ncbi:unnamed protein product, partial [Musa acuminata subsp. burmannicoides]
DNEIGKPSNRLSLPSSDRRLLPLRPGRGLPAAPMPRGRRTEPSRCPTRCSSFGAIDGVHLGRSSSESMWNSDPTSSSDSAAARTRVVAFFCCCRGEIDDKEQEDGAVARPEAVLLRWGRSS